MIDCPGPVNGTTVYVSAGGQCHWRAPYNNVARVCGRSGCRFGEEGLRGERITTDYGPLRNGPRPSLSKSALR